MTFINLTIDINAEFDVSLDVEFRPSSNTSDVALSECTFEDEEERLIALEIEGLRFHSDDNKNSCTDCASVGQAFSTPDPGVSPVYANGELLGNLNLTTSGPQDDGGDGDGDVSVGDGYVDFGDADTGSIGDSTQFGDLTVRTRDLVRIATGDDDYTFRSNGLSLPGGRLETVDEATPHITSRSLERAVELDFEGLQSGSEIDGVRLRSRQWGDMSPRIYLDKVLSGKKRIRSRPRTPPYGTIDLLVGTRENLFSSGATASVRSASEWSELESELSPEELQRLEQESVDNIVSLWMLNALDSFFQDSEGVDVRSVPSRPISASSRTLGLPQSRKVSKDRRPKRIGLDGLPISSDPSPEGTQRTDDVASWEGDDELGHDFMDTIAELDGPEALALARAKRDRKQMTRMKKTSSGKSTPTEDVASETTDRMIGIFLHPIIESELRKMILQDDDEDEEVYMDRLRLEKDRLEKEHAELEGISSLKKRLEDVEEDSSMTERTKHTDDINPLHQRPSGSKKSVSIYEPEVPPPAPYVQLAPLDEFRLFTSTGEPMTSNIGEGPVPPSTPLPDVILPPTQSRLDELELVAKKLLTPDRFVPNAEEDLPRFYQNPSEYISAMGVDRNDPLWPLIFSWLKKTLPVGWKIGTANKKRCFMGPNDVKQNMHPEHNMMTSLVRYKDIIAKTPAGQRPKLLIKTKSAVQSEVKGNTRFLEFLHTLSSWYGVTKEAEQEALDAEFALQLGGGRSGSHRRTSKKSYDSGRHGSRRTSAFAEVGSIKRASFMNLSGNTMIEDIYKLPGRKKTNPKVVTKTFDFFRRIQEEKDNAYDQFIQTKSCPYTEEPSPRKPITNSTFFPCQFEGRLMPVMSLAEQEYEEMLKSPKRTDRKPGESWLQWSLEKLERPESGRQLPTKELLQKKAQVVSQDYLRNLYLNAIRKKVVTDRKYLNSLGQEVIELFSNVLQPHKKTPLKKLFGGPPQIPKEIMKPPPTHQTLALGNLRNRRKQAKVFAALTDRVGYENASECFLMDSPSIPPIPIASS